MVTLFVALFATVGVFFARAASNGKALIDPQYR